MCSANVLLVLACALTFAASVGAQNITNPLANVTNPLANITNPLANVTNPSLPNITNPLANVTNPSLPNITNPLANVTNPSLPNITNPLANVTNPSLPNVTAPVIMLNSSANGTLSPMLNFTSVGPATVSNASLAIYRQVRAGSRAALIALGNGSIVGVASYITEDLQLFLPNTTGPVTLDNTSTLLSFLPLLTPPGGFNTTSNKISELYFYFIDSTNVVIVDEVNLGQFGNLYVTAFFSLLNSTTSPYNGTWLAHTVSFAPAPAAAYVLQPTPTFVFTPYINLTPPRTYTYRFSGSLYTSSYLRNSTLPTNATVEAQVIAASNALQETVFGVAPIANISTPFVAPWTQFVLPFSKSPTPLNLSDPSVAAFITTNRARNATGTAAPPTVVSFRQLNAEAAILTTLVPALPGVGDIHFLQLWQSSNFSSGSNLSTGINATIPATSSRSPRAKSWQLTLASVNLAAPWPIAPIPNGATTPVSLASTDTPSPTSSAGAPGSAVVPTLVPNLRPGPNTPPDPSPTPTFQSSNTTSTDSGSNVGVVVGASLGATAVVVGALLAGLWFFLARRRKARKQRDVAVDKDRGADREPPRIGVGLRVASGGAHAHNVLGLTRPFAYRDIRKATGGFSDATLIGSGAFGRVYKATFSDGSVLAVKELRKGPAGAGEDEFLNELATIARVRHRNLVTLVGYCISNKGYHLIMDFAPNGNLSSALSEGSRTPLSWKQRLIIATGAARGLSYLHNDMDPSILHRDIKSANILLNGNLEALVADFGLAKLIEQGLTHHSTIVRGTYGYVAPEYAIYGKVSKQSDVYSFGVVLLELLTGRRAVETMADGTRCNLVDAVARHYHEPLVIMDPKLRGQFSEQTATQLVVLASACTAREETHRPQMSHVFRELEDISRLLDTNNENVSNLTDQNGQDWFGRSGQSSDGARNEPFSSNSTGVWSGQGESSGSGARMDSMAYEMSMIRDGR